MNTLIYVMFVLATLQGCEIINNSMNTNTVLEDMSVVGDDQETVQQGNAGSLPRGFNQRGCQWDSPACGQPVPGGKAPATDPIR